MELRRRASRFRAPLLCAWLNYLGRLFKRSLASQARSKTFSVCPRLLSKYHAISWEHTNLKRKAFIIRSKFFFLFVGRKATTWPANNCLQLIVCSCAMPSNCVWLQIIFCTWVKETVLFSFLRSLLHENGTSLRFPRIFIKKKKQTRWSNDKAIIELDHCKISWFVSVSQINNLSARHRQITIFCSTSSNNG